MDVMPKWAEVVLVPLISLLLAAILSALVILAIGEAPIAAVELMVQGALGSTYGWGYTLYYATNFIFTGLAVAIAFHARMFNIGGEGQAILGGLGVAIVCLYIPWPHWTLAVLGATAGAALFLKERVGLRRWSAILVGFVGTVIILRPGAGILTLPALLALGNAVLIAFRRWP